MTLRHLLPLTVLGVSLFGCPPKEDDTAPDGDTDTDTDTDTDADTDVDMAQSWSFDDSTDLPDGFSVADGTWEVDADEGACSAPNVLRQTGSGTYPRALYEGATWQDATLSVRCRPESGLQDQACGLLFRAVDEDNYLLTRANALEDNVRLYTVIDGSRVEFASADVPVTAGEWHSLSVQFVGSDITVSWDDATVLTESDDTFLAPGFVGVWTKADSVTAFDDLAVTPD
jgi:hypothetical protein